MARRYIVRAETADKYAVVDTQTQHVAFYENRQCANLTLSAALRIAYDLNKRPEERR